MSSLISSFSAYETYLSKTYERVGTIKTFADPTKPVPLLDHFVETKLHQNGGDEINQDDIRHYVTEGGKVVISALAGFGKSVLMRFLALSFYENPVGKIPIFIELRDINRIKDPDLISYIHGTYKQNSQLGKDAFEKAMSSGVFALFLDGFDEINFEHRDDIQKQIIDISSKYPLVAVIVSGRPDPRFDSWEKFSTYHVKPMTLDQVTLLIEKIKYDEGLKKKFLAKLKSGLYKKHESFLSTPLLATLMMLTYEQNANIPDKMHLFYLRAFETLFDKHDTYKEQYERKRKTTLRIDHFAKLFSVFCFNTYVAEEFEFSKTGLLSYLSDAVSYCGFEIDEEDLLFDLVESVCLLQLEGQFYSFVHRSFQEYFTAFFLHDCADDFRNEFLDDFNLRQWDTVLPMLFDMCQDRVEVGWVLPRLSEYIARIEQRKVAISRAVLNEVWSKVHLTVKPKNSAAFRMLVPGQSRQMMAVLKAFYSDRFPFSTNHLFSHEVDELGKQLCEVVGLEYLEISQASLTDRRSSNYREFDVIETRNFPIKNALVKRVLDDHKVAMSVKNSVGDHKIVQQRFLAKMKTKHVTKDI